MASVCYKASELNGYFNLEIVSERMKEERGKRGEKYGKEGTEGTDVEIKAN